MIISLIGEIDTIIWDEPNNGLDIVSNIKIKNILRYYKSKNITILFSSHVIEFLENFVDHCILLHKGEVIENNDIQNIGSLEKLFLKNIPENELIRYFETDEYLHKKFKECSTGMKKKVQMIISLIGEIDTIIWDEPNNGLDIVSNIKIKNLLNHYKSKNITILFSSHVIEFLENFVDHCILIHKGEVIENNDIQNIGSLEKLFLKNIPENDLILNIK